LIAGVLSGCPLHVRLVEARPGFVLRLADAQSLAIRHSKSWGCY